MVSFADLIGNLLSTAAAAGEYFPVLEEEEEADDGDDDDDDDGNQNEDENDDENACHVSDFPGLDPKPLKKYVFWCIVIVVV